jgi:hypothetical protein
MGRKLGSISVIWKGAIISQTQAVSHLFSSLSFDEFEQSTWFSRAVTYGHAEVRGPHANEPIAPRLQPFSTRIHNDDFLQKYLNFISMKIHERGKAVFLPALGKLFVIKEDMSKRSSHSYSTCAKVCGKLDTSVIPDNPAPMTTILPIDSGLLSSQPRGPAHARRLDQTLPTRRAQ